MIRAFLEGRLSHFETSDGKRLERPVNLIKKYPKLRVPIRIMLAKIKDARAYIERAATRQGIVTTEEEELIAYWESLLDDELLRVKNALGSRSEKDASELTSKVNAQVERLQARMTEKTFLDATFLKKVLSKSNTGEVLAEKAAEEGSTRDKFMKDINDKFIVALQSYINYEKKLQENYDAVDRKISSAIKFEDREREFTKELRKIAEVKEAFTEHKKAADDFIASLTPKRSKDRAAQSIGQAALDSFVQPLHREKYAKDLISKVNAQVKRLQARVKDKTVLDGTFLHEVLSKSDIDDVLAQKAAEEGSSRDKFMKDVNNKFIAALQSYLKYEQRRQKHYDTVDRKISSAIKFEDRQKKLEEELRKIAEVEDAFREHKKASDDFIASFTPQRIKDRAAQSVGQAALDSFVKPLHQDRDYLFYGTDTRDKDDFEKLLIAARENIQLVKELADTVRKHRNPKKKSK